MLNYSKYWPVNLWSLQFDSAVGYFRGFFFFFFTVVMSSFMKEHICIWNQAVLYTSYQMLVKSVMQWLFKRITRTEWCSVLLQVLASVFRRRKHNVVENTLTEFIYSTPQSSLNSMEARQKGNCDFLSHNSDFFFSQLPDYISQFWLFFSELWDKNTQLWEMKSELWDINSVLRT